ncbi:16857_t:CDS:2, partial [Acaulospora colombiana]
LLHSWKDTTSNATKVLRPLTVFAILGKLCLDNPASVLIYLISACWEYQTQYGSPPSSEESCGELETIANRLLRRAQVRQKVCTSIPKDAVEYLSTTAAREWTPSCAVVGGMLGQDVLKALAAREPPMANFFFFDGPTCNGTVVRMGMPEGRLPGSTLPTAVAQSTVLEID